MDEAKLYWTIVVVIVSAAWAMTAFIRDRVSQSVERTGVIVNRLLEGDKLIIDNPDIQKYISQTAMRDEQYFRDEAAVLNEVLFYKAKTFAYRQLNSFDEILSISSRTTGKFSFLKPPALLEIADWEGYIRVILRHPLYRSILNTEKDIFGKALREFWKHNKRDIESTPVERFIW